MGNSVNTLCTCVISDDNLDASMFEEYDIGPPPRLSITPYYPEEVPYLFSNDSELGTPLSLEDESTTILIKEKISFIGSDFYIHKAPQRMEARENEPITSTISAICAGGR